MSKLTWSNTKRLEQKFTVVIVLLMSASLSMFSFLLSPGHSKNWMAIYLGVIAVILVFWLIGMTLIKKNHKE